MLISRLAKEAGVNIETIRFYERKGLITRPERPPRGGYRRYPREIVKRIRMIRKAKDLAFSLKEIGELLSLRADPEAGCAEVIKRLQRKLKELDEASDRLSTVRSNLEYLISICAGKSMPARSCPVFEVLENEESQLTPLPDRSRSHYGGSAKHCLH